jgi:galactokinase
MKRKIFASTPSRICLFGEHQDYLGLEVIALAVDLRFRASAVKREDEIIKIKIRDEKFNYLGAENTLGLFEKAEIDLSKPIVYKDNRDYLKSTINILLKNGYKFDRGFDILMDSEIPIGKGMSSSTTMIIVLIKTLLEMIDSPDKDNSEKIALLGFEAEVEEFNEPGGMMDHFTSALGGLVHLKFNEITEVSRLEKVLPGSFILFDTMEQKNTIKILGDTKVPLLAALEQLKENGINSVRDFYDDESNMKYLDRLDDIKKIKLTASIDNYKILKQAEKMLKGDSFSQERFGNLITQHHVNLRDALNISTPAIERILNTAYANGALGGKVNGSGGGGCLYVYAHDEDCDRIVNAVKEIGYPGKVLKPDDGVRKDGEEGIQSSFK